jgi:hypothetical protein
MGRVRNKGVAMTGISRLLALGVGVAAASACSGSGPADPSGGAPGAPSAAVPGDATAMGQAGCADVTGVLVKVVPAVSVRDVTLRAIYLYATTPTQACAAAPTWQASRAGLSVDAQDPFRASMARRSDVKTTVTATAPDGVAGSITF